WDGLGTTKPKSSASLLKDARRMKCSVLVAASQMRITVWSALTTGLPEGGAGQQAGTGGEPRAGAAGRVAASGSGSPCAAGMDVPPNSGDRGAIIKTREGGVIFPGARRLME